jgi:hypothetical protein
MDRLAIARITIKFLAAVIGRNTRCARPGAEFSARSGLICAGKTLGKIAARRFPVREGAFCGQKSGFFAKSCKKSGFSGEYAVDNRFGAFYSSLLWRHSG